MAKLPAHVAAFGIHEGQYFSSERPEMLVAGGHAGKLRHRQNRVNGCVLWVRIADTNYVASLGFSASIRRRAVRIRTISLRTNLKSQRDGLTSRWHS
jgi:hypothetical protein